MHKPNEQLHAIWSDLIYIFLVLQYWQIMPHPRFCFVLNASRPLLELEQKFFNEQRAGNGMWHLTIVEFRHWTLDAKYHPMQYLSSQYSPSLMISSFSFMIGIGKKRVAPMPPRWSRRSLKCHWRTLGIGLRGMSALKVRLYTCYFKHSQRTSFPALDDDEGDHQEQVKGLIEKTAASLDDLALKMLFVSVQQNNLELCINYAIYE